MKTRNTLTSGLIALAACAALLTGNPGGTASAADQFNEGAGAPRTLMSYTRGSGHYYQQYGTNNASGWTNTTPVYMDLGGKSSLNLFLRAAAYSNAPSNLTLVIKPAYSAATNDVATTAAARIALLLNATTFFQVSTNVTGIYTPGVQIFLENPAPNESITNLVLKGNAKTP